MEIHAHLVIAPSIDVADIATELKSESLDTAHFIRGRFGIDDARELVRVSAQKAWEGERSFVVFTESITHEAQNALLKLFEDTPSGAVFYLVIPDHSILLPTLRSRLIETSRSNNISETGEVKEFLAMSYGERMEFIATRAKNKPESLERLVIDIGNSGIKDEELKRSLLIALRYIRNRGASRKMLVEELAISLPG